MAGVSPMGGRDWPRAGGGGLHSTSATWQGRPSTLVVGLSWGLLARVHRWGGGEHNGGLLRRETRLREAGGGCGGVGGSVGGGTR